VTDDPNTIYTMAIFNSMAEGGNVGATFEKARDNPKIPKSVLMAAVIAGWQAAMALYPNGKS